MIPMHGHDEGWTPENVLTIIVAATSAAFALGAMVAAFIANAQTRKYFPRPYLQVEAGGWASRFGGPGYRFTLRNVGEVDAREVWVAVRPPKSKTYKHGGYRPVVEAHTPWEDNYSLVNGESNDLHYLVPEPEFAGVEPVYGLWRWRVRLHGSPNPTRQKTIRHWHWVTKSRYKKHEYTSVG